jgi:hypothetical protein
LNVNTDNSLLWKRCKSSGHLLFIHTLFDVVDSYLKLGVKPDVLDDKWLDTALFTGMVWHDLQYLHKFYGNERIES